MWYYQFVHSIGIHMWELPALAALILMVIFGIVHGRNQKKRENDFEDEMEEKIQSIREGNVTPQEV